MMTSINGNTVTRLESVCYRTDGNIYHSSYQSILFGSLVGGVVVPCWWHGWGMWGVISHTANSSMLILTIEAAGDVLWGKAWGWLPPLGELGLGLALDLHVSLCTVYINQIWISSLFSSLCYRERLPTDGMRCYDKADQAKTQRFVRYLLYQGWVHYLKLTNKSWK